MAFSRPAHEREPLPSELNTSSGSLAFLEVGKDKLSVKYNGPAQHDNDVGSIQANHPVPRRQLVYYFEVTVREANGGSITLGFSDRNFKQGRHPGYEPHSYGYRGDTGRKHHSSLPARGEEYGPSFGPGDVVGAGIHLTKHEIFFTKNGQHLGTAFRGVSGHPLYPTLGLHSQGARVEVNFGRRPFQFNVAALVASEQQQQAEALESTSVSAGEVHQLVRGYLLHYGYAQSLAAFDEAAGLAALDAAPGGTEQPQQQQQQQQQQGLAGGSSGAAGTARPSSVAANGARASGGAVAAPLAGPGGSGGQDASALALLPVRAELRRLLMAGDTAAARQLLQEQAPELLAAPAVPPSSSVSPGGSGGGGSGSGGSGGSGSGSGSFKLQFHLACQQYIELIRRGDIVGALGYAEGTLSTLRGASPEHDAHLRDVVALIAYQHPAQSPLAPLLAPAQREATADVVNAALLRSRAPPGSLEPQAALESVLRQLVAAQRELHSLAGGHGPEFDLQEHLPQLSGTEQQQQAQHQSDSGGRGGGGGVQEEEAEPMAE